MLKKSLIFLSIVLAVHAKNIPVEIRYDEPIKTSASENQEKNIQEVENSPNAIKNLEAKVQLSTFELSEASKHLPVQEEIEVPSEEVKNDLRSAFPEETKLGEINKKSEVTPLVLYNRAHEIVTVGLKSIRKNLENIKNVDEQPSEEQWQSLEKAVNNYFEAEKTKQADLKQDQSQSQNIIQNIIGNINNISNSFLQSFSPNPVTGANGTQSDEQQPPAPIVWGQNFVNGIQSIQTSISNLVNPSQQPTTSNTNLSDSPTQAPPANIFTNFVSNLQNLVTGGQGNINVFNISQQGDEGTGQAPAGPQGPLQLIQNVGGNIGNAVNNFLTGGQSTKPPGTSSDEDGVVSSTAAPQNGPFQIIQTFQNQIGNAINNIANIGQTTAKPPGATGDEATQAPPTNFISSIGQAFQSFIQGGSQQGGNNPIVQGVQNVQNQINQVTQGNPIETVQNAIAGVVNGQQPSTAEKKPVDEEPPKEPVKVPEEPSQEPEKQSENESEKEPVKGESQQQVAEKKEIMLTVE